jgi:hypothetical protein
LKKKSRVVIYHCTLDVTDSKNLEGGWGKMLKHLILKAVLTVTPPAESTTGEGVSTRKALI